LLRSIKRDAGDYSTHQLKEKRMSDYDHEDCTCKHKQESNGSAAVYILFVPFIIIIIIFSVFGWFLAKAGYRYRTVQVITLPAWFFLSNFIAAITLLPASFMYSLFSGNKEGATWQLIGDLLVWPVWGRILSFCFRMGLTDFILSIPVGAVMTFQLILFLAVGHRLSRHLTCTIMDMATVANARNQGIDPYSARQVRLREDAGYAAAARYYEKTGKPPLLGFFGVAATGTWPNDFYHFLRS
jgi:hypothetical protein